MTWTFNPADLGTETLAKVRDELGDTDTTDQQLSDEQIYRYCGGVITITVTNGGTGYTSTPAVEIAAPTNPNGTQAQATATIAGGAVTGVTIIAGKGGSFYTEDSPPVVSFSGGGGTGAAATAAVGTPEANWILAAARCAMNIAAKYARKVDAAAGSLRANRSDIYKHYRDLAAELRKRALKYASPYIGGISQADKDGNNANNDNITPSFYRNIQDNPGIQPTSPPDPSQWV